MLLVIVASFFVLISADENIVEENNPRSKRFIILKALLGGLGRGGGYGYGGLVV